MFFAPDLFDSLLCLLCPITGGGKTSGMQKALKQQSISIRCSPPQARRKVPLHFDAWVLMSDTGSSDNLFAECLLIQDRP